VEGFTAAINDASGPVDHNDAVMGDNIDRNEDHNTDSKEDDNRDLDDFAALGANDGADPFNGINGSIIYTTMSETATPTAWTTAMASRVYTETPTRSMKLPTLPLPPPLAPLAPLAPLPSLPPILLSLRSLRCLRPPLNPPQHDLRGR